LQLFDESQRGVKYNLPCYMEVLLQQ